jgi:hypothetical protein
VFGQEPAEVPVSDIECSISYSPLQGKGRPFIDTRPERFQFQARSGVHENNSLPGELDVKSGVAVDCDVSPTTAVWETRIRWREGI